MLRFLLILIALVVLLRLLGWTPPGRRARGSGAPAAPAAGSGMSGAAASGPASAAPGLELVPCATCGVYVPRTQALAQGGHWFCSPDHRQRGAVTRSSAGSR